MKNTKIVTIVIGLLLVGSIHVYAYTSGFCQVNGCSCHQYIGNNGGANGVGPCKSCGHNKAQHS